MPHFPLLGDLRFGSECSFHLPALPDCCSSWTTEEMPPFLLWPLYFQESSSSDTTMYLPHLSIQQLESIEGLEIRRESHFNHLCSNTTSTWNFWGDTPSLGWNGSACRGLYRPLFMHYCRCLYMGVHPPTHYHDVEVSDLRLACLCFSMRLSPGFIAWMKKGRKKIVKWKNALKCLAKYMLNNLWGYMMRITLPYQYQLE